MSGSSKAGHLSPQVPPKNVFCCKSRLELDFFAVFCRLELDYLGTKKSFHL